MAGAFRLLHAVVEANIEDQSFIAHTFPNDVLRAAWLHFRYRLTSDLVARINGGFDEIAGAVQALRGNRCQTTQMREKSEKKRVKAHATFAYRTLAVTVLEQ